MSAPAYPSPALREALAAQGLATEEVIQWLRAEEVETAADLRFAFRTAEQVARDAPALNESWAWVVRVGPTDWELRVEGQRAALQASLASASAGDPVSESRRRVAKRRKAIRPRSKAKVEPRRAHDASTREAAAAEAVRRSLSWGPRTGIAKDVPAGDPLLERIRAIFVQRVATFEARSVLGALRVLDDWVTYHDEQATVHTTKEAEVLMSSFIQDRPAATGPLTAWNRLDWVRRHLQIELPMSAVPKPGRQETTSSGKVQAAEQAVAVPPEYLVAYEEVLRRMEEAGDWRRVAVAAGLQVGYVSVRPVHVGRSAFESEGSIVFWLEAYRGKGKRQGTRRPFKWAMPRFGLTGIDIGGIIHRVWDF